MNVTILTTTILSSIVPPDYYEEQILETPSFVATHTVEWWEHNDQFIYTIENDLESISPITYWEVTGLFDFNYQLNPGSIKKFILFGNGFGYEPTGAFVFSDFSNDFVSFETISPIIIPGPGSFALLTLSFCTALNRRRRV